MSEHTPGPWESEATMVWAPEAQKVVCEASNPCPSSGLVKHEQVTCGSEYLAEVFANARLIAAAPKLLEACKKLVDWAIEIDVENDDTDYGCSRDWDALVREGAASQQILNAQAAIAEAEKQSTGSG